MVALRADDRRLGIACKPSAITFMTAFSSAITMRAATEPRQRDTPNRSAFAAISRILRSRCAVA